jgi:toxin ParE1/3/4
MAYQIKWSPRATNNLENICNYIAKDSEYYATIFAKRVFIINSLVEFPKSGRIVPEYGSENIREKIYENYRIVYRLKEEFIEIVAISHSARLRNIFRS